MAVNDNIFIIKDNKLKENTWKNISDEKPSAKTVALHEITSSEEKRILTKDGELNRVLGGGIVGTHAGDLIGEICLAVEMGCDPIDIGKTIHPHPTLSESIGMAAEVFEGVCTDLPPARR